MESKELKVRIIAAGRRAVEQLIKVAQEDIIKPNEEDELAADRLKNAAATKKLAIFDEQEQLDLSVSTSGREDTKQGFAERRSK